LPFAIASDNVRDNRPKRLQQLLLVVAMTNNHRRRYKRDQPGEAGAIPLMRLLRHTRVCLQTHCDPTNVLEK
jgi:hypothetical protein